MSAALLALLVLSSAVRAEAPDFSGVWVEAPPQKGPPLKLEATQSGSRVQVRIGSRENLSGRVQTATILENGIATWSSPQGCIARFQRPGYNYDNPGENIYTLSLSRSAESGGSEPLLVYVVETHWNVPCANNHPIGTERTQRILRRR